ncbi:TIM-barrel domain-containing protein [Chryseoglobus sp. 28M-23]|uniref:glycoside hydrolase family 31 protein n=1 Tax=Chryseoglobus sp. 28M-23 TaxID=2772253 RepID=UPI0017468CF2|nr:TIM-barrel domain-containing protein [Chryseoglobus sp. 28M-23]QOD92968.1 glycoside hydrolase family 31 [Chryseoglobus sp. 28M-23]
MIRHSPFGSGHPYSVDTDQRDPVDPVAGEPLTLGVRTSAEVDAVVLEWDDGVTVHEHPLTRTERTSRGQSVDGGHLASAQARLARAARGFSATLTDLEPHRAYRYRFVGGPGDSSTSQHTRWFDVRVAAWRSAPDDLVAVDVAAGLVPGSVEVLDDGERLLRARFALALVPGERVAGFGERFDALDHRGAELDSVVFEQYKSQGAERKTYLPMPFAHVVGGRGWGFHVRTSRRVWFDVGATAGDRLQIEAEVDEASAVSRALELAAYTGTPHAVLDAFLGEVGRPEQLPDWVLRLWASGNEWNTQAEVMRQADAHREHDIPVGSIVIEAWSDESTFHIWRDAQYTPREDAAPMRLADFTFPAEGAWPDPKGMVDELHERDVRLVLWQIPLLKMRPHPRGQLRHDADVAKAEGVLIREPGPDGRLRPYRNRGWWFPLGLMPDLTDERAAEWWTEKRRYLVDELGVDGFKTDGGEHAWGRELQYLDGRRGDEGNNTFPVAYAKAYGDLLRRCGKAPVTFSRAGFTGSQAHGAFWAGDENSTWEAFRWSLFAGLSATASGVLYWGWDVAGFSGEIPTAELYLRSMAAAAFVPIMQYHSEFNHHRSPSRDRTPWNIAERTRDDRVLPGVRRLVQLRERLVPYLSVEAAWAIGSGTSLMRPLFFDWPDDDRLWSAPLQWMLGRDILVSPVTEEGATAHTATLPAGEWVHAFSGEQVTGGATHTTEVPWDEVPVYVRADSWPRLRAVFTE